MTETAKPKGSKGATTRYNRHVRLLGGLKSLWLDCKSFRWDFRTWLERRSKWFESKDYQKANTAEREYLRGWSDCMSEALYRYDLEFRHQFQGVWCTWDEMIGRLKDIGYDYYADYIRENPEPESAHVWKRLEEWDKGVHRVWYTSPKAEVKASDPT